MQSIATPQNRDTSVDIAKGIGIYLVVLGHTCNNELIRSFIYSFHMPLFFFFSGYFFKFQPIKKLIRKTSISLILPYIILALILETNNLLSLSKLGSSFLKIIFADGYINDTLFIKGIPYIGILWFLPALFWSRIIYQLISEKKYTAFFSAGISITAFILGRYIINIPFGFLEGAQAVFFYWAGHTYHQKENSTPIKKHYYAIMAIIWVGSIFRGNMSMANFCYHWYPICILGAISGCIILHKAIKKITPNALTAFIGWAGKNSLIIYSIHAFLLTYFSSFTKTTQCILNLFGCTIITLLYTRLKVRVTQQSEFRE